MSEKNNIVKTLIKTFDKFIESFDILSKFLLDAFKIFTDLMPYLNDGIPFFKLFLPLILIIFVFVEIYISIFN